MISAISLPGASARQSITTTPEEVTFPACELVITSDVDVSVGQSAAEANALTKVWFAGSPLPIKKATDDLTFWIRGATGSGTAYIMTGV